MFRAISVTRRGEHGPPSLHSDGFLFPFDRRVEQPDDMRSGYLICSAIMRAALIAGICCVVFGISTHTVNGRDRGRGMFDQSPGVPVDQPVEPPEAALRGIPALFPELGAPRVTRDERAVTAYYNPAGGGQVRLRIIVESFDTEVEAEAGRTRSETTTPAYRTRQEIVGGILCSVWDSGRLLGRIGRHIADVTGRFMPEGDPLVRRVFESLVATLAVPPRVREREPQPLVPIVGDPGRRREARATPRRMRDFSVPPRRAPYPAGRVDGTAPLETKCAGPNPPRTLGEIVGADARRIVVREYDADWIDLPTVADYIRRLWSAETSGWWPFQLFSERAPSEIDASIESADGRLRPLELGNGYAHAMDAARCEWWMSFIGPDPSRSLVR